ncbi:MAG: AAA family ATPase [Alphaproteobacteria bacterium]|nr:AAA family ATPase [Alphaproteobacteria bacterium]
MTDPDILDLIGEPPGGPPEKERAAPAGTRNGSKPLARFTHHQDSKKIPETQEFLDLFYDLIGGEPDPLDVPVGLSFFDGVKGTRPTLRRMSLRKAVAEFTCAHPVTKDGLPMVKAGVFEGGSKAEHLACLSAIEADYDGAAKAGIQPGDAAAMLTRAGISALIVTTPSHRPYAPRWRVFAPLSAPVTPSEHSSLVDRLNGALHGALDGESWTAARRYFIGHPERGNPKKDIARSAPPTVIEVTGGYIDRVDGIAPIGKPGRTDPVPVAEAEEDAFAGVDLLDYTRARAALDSIPPAARNDRETWLRAGMALHHESGGSDDAYRLWQAWSAVSPKFDQRVQKRTWEGFGDSRSAPVTLASLIALARDYEGESATDPAPAVKGRLSFLSPAECEASPPRGYLIKGILAPGDVACIFGAPGAGKSLLAPHLGYAAAQGRDAFGTRTKAGPVFYVAAEDPHGMRARIAALRSTHGDAPDFTLVEGVGDLLTAKSPDLAALLLTVRERRPSLIFIDTLALAFPGLEENSAEGMGRVVAVARRLASHGAAVILVHHDTKADGGTPRGHSVLNGALDMALHVRRDESGIVRATLTKNRNGSCERDIAFRIGTVRLGEDEDGEDVTAALVKELSNPPERSKLSQVQQAALSILCELESQAAANDPDFGADVGVEESAWRVACIASRAVSASGTEESRKRVVRRVVRDLSRQGRIRFEGTRAFSAKPNKYRVLDDLPPLPGQGGQSPDTGWTRQAHNPAEGRTDTDTPL